MNWIDPFLIVVYLIVLIVLSWRRRDETTHEVGYLLSGRRLTIPAFVATLVSTWYGGILGVGEFTWLYGISQWIVMGLPYYIFAVLFAVFFAAKVRQNPAMSIPEAVGNAYGAKASSVSAVLLFLLVNPAPYILMVAVIAGVVFGGDPLWITASVAGFSALYVCWGGFGAVVRTDKLQFVLMFAGFMMLLGFAWHAWGSPAEVWSLLPETHRSPTGGQSVGYLLVWFFIAMWTFVDPSFHQRAAAAKDAQTARKGIFWSVGLWFIFDMTTLICALYGVAMLSGLENAVMVYPEMARELLPVGLSGLFLLALLATVMSTLDSYLFLSGQTLGRDFLRAWFPERSNIRLTQISILIAAAMGVLLVILIPSVIELWYVIGSVLIPGLLIPVVGIYYPFFRVRREVCLYLLVMPVLTSLGWMSAGMLTSGSEGYAFLGIEPFYPGLLISVVIYGISALSGGGKARVYE